MHVHALQCDLAAEPTLISSAARQMEPGDEESGPAESQQ